MIHPKETLFLRHSVGTAEIGKGKNKRKFEMATNVADMQPIIRLPDGRWWTIGWQKLLEMAEKEAADRAT